MEWDQYAVGGATRPDSFSGMTPDFNAALEQMFANAPPEIQAKLRVGSGFRSPERQQQLWAEALVKYGSPEAARKWVAPPGKSQHNHGNAADLKYLDPVAREWVHQNAEKFGLAFPLSNEPWHVELAGARGGKQPAPQQYAQAGQQNALAPQQEPAKPQLSLVDMRTSGGPLIKSTRNALAQPFNMTPQNYFGAV